MLADLLAYIASTPWAIDERAARQYVAALRTMQAPPQARPEGGRKPRRDGMIAIVPLQGVMVPRNSPLNFGGTVVGLDVVAAVGAALADDDVAAVVLDIDSPGGAAAGTPEAAGALLRLRETSDKPIVAVARYLTASAAYWMASAAHEIVASPSSFVGSVGVLASHTDMSGLDEKLGLDVTYVYAGRWKVEGNPHEALSDPAREHMQAIVDDIYSDFVAAVARGRGTTGARVRADYGEGRVLLAADALRAGMVDRVETMGETLARLATPRGRNAAMRPRADDDGLGLGANAPDFLRVAADADIPEATPAAPSAADPTDLAAAILADLQERT